MPSRATWNDFELVVRGLSELRTDQPITGRFAIDSDEGLRALRACLESSEVDTNLILGDGRDPASLDVGQTVKLELGSPRIGFGLLLLKLDDLLATPFARVQEPPRYIVLDAMISSADCRNDDGLLSRYRSVLALIEMFNRSAVYLDRDEQTLVFIRKGKFEIPCSYCAKDLRDLPAETVRQLAAIVPKGPLEKQCQAIMADAVTEMTALDPPEQRFARLLRNASELKKRYEDGYNILASEFSYEKVRDQVEAARVEYTGKIHKVFADIQNQLLGIPVATIVVATQMKAAKAIGYEFWLNVSVLIGCWVFAVLMMFVLNNQSQTLEVVSTEIERQKRQLAKEYAKVSASFSDVFLQLTRRAMTQHMILRTIGGFVVLGLFLSHVVFFELTAPAQDALRRWIPRIFGSP